MESDVQKSTYIHDAFISYSRTDKEFAKRLEKALEAYKPPKDLKVPQRNLDVFRDEEDFTGVEYQHSVAKHLKDSAKLIVLCSPNSRKSEYVNDEIRLFTETNGADNVISILVSGIPNNEAKLGQEEEMAFPGALCEAMEMPLAVNYLGFDLQKDKVNKGIFYGPWYTILANIYNISRGEIEQREKKREARTRRLRRGIVGGVITVLLVALVVTLFFWRQAVDQRKIAEERRKIALARQLAAQAEATMDGTADGLTRSVLLSLESLNSAWTHEGYGHWARGIDLLPRQPVNVFQAHTDEVGTMAISHNGSWLATRSRDQTIGVWELTSGRELKRLQEPAAMYTSMAFSPNGQWLAAGCGFEVCVWDTTTWQELKLPGGEDRVWSVVFSPDGRRLATTGSPIRKIQVFETATWNKSILEGPKNLWTTMLSFSSDSRWLIVAGLRGVEALEVATRRHLDLLRSAGNVDTAALSPNGQWLATVASNGAIRLWQVRINEDGTLQLLEDWRRKPTGKLILGTRAVVFSADGNYLVTAGDDGAARIWEAETSREVARLVQDVNNAVFTPDLQWLVTGHKNGTIGIWSVGDDWEATHEKDITRLQHDNPVRFISFSSKGQWLATASEDGVARIFDVAAWHESARKEHQDGVLGVAFSPNDRLFITINMNKVHVFETVSWRKVTQMEHNGQQVDKVAFSPDAKWLILRTDPPPFEGSGLLLETLWEISTGRKVAWMSKDHESRNSQNPPDESILQERQGGQTGLLSELSAGHLAWLPVRYHRLFQARSPDGRWLVSALSRSGKVELELLEANTKRRVAVMVYKGNVEDMAFSPEGRWLATAGSGNMVRVWPLWTKDLVEVACARLTRNLTEEEWNTYLPDEPYHKTCPDLPGPKA